MHTKRFDKKLCDENDSLGKAIATDIMACLGFKLVRENTSEGVDFSEGFWDLEFEKGGKTIKVEVEVKNKKWWGDFDKKYPFKYDELNVPARKKKNSADIYFLVSSDSKYAFAISGRNLKACDIRPTYNKHVEDEDMYKIPYNKGFWFENINGNWKKIT